MLWVSPFLPSKASSHVPIWGAKKEVPVAVELGGVPPSIWLPFDFSKTAGRNPQSNASAGRTQILRCHSNGSNPMNMWKITHMQSLIHVDRSFFSMFSPPFHTALLNSWRLFSGISEGSHHLFHSFAIRGSPSVPGTPSTSSKSFSLSTFDENEENSKSATGADTTDQWWIYTGLFFKVLSSKFYSKTGITVTEPSAFKFFFFVFCLFLRSPAFFRPKATWWPRWFQRCRSASIVFYFVFGLLFPLLGGQKAETICIWTMYMKTYIGHINHVNRNFEELL